MKRAAPSPLIGRLAVLAIVALAAVASPQETPAVATLPEGAIVRAARAAGAAPGLTERIDRLGRGFDGRVGIAVRDLDEGWTATYDGDLAAPQQSVSKLWVALAALEAVDQGRMGLGDTLLVRKDDLSVFHQPLRKHVGDRGYEVSVAELLDGAITVSDNAANDVLVRRVGGADAVQAVLAAKELRGLRASPPEREMQTELAGLEWDRSFSFGRAFWIEREKLPLEFRVAALEKYLEDPADAATPFGLVEALDRLQRGELLSPASTALLLKLLAECETGASRLKAGLPEGWSLAHKTGTGQVMGPVATGFNDVGIIRAPDGHGYAVAVMIAQTRAGVPERQDLMAEVARAVVAHHAGRKS